MVLLVVVVVVLMVLVVLLVVAIAKLVPYDCCADGVDGSVDDGDDDGISGLLLFFMEHGYRYCSSS